ncbi:MAG: Error-prone repair protein ImuA [Bacteroidota bacterium]|nr:Error-prone repair protein ImuA [Bacteroidota bacterium]
METTKAHILAGLQRDILPLQGYKPADGNIGFDGGLGIIKNAFPNASFPLGAIHEFCCSRTEDVSASTGFIAGIISAIMQKGGVTIWISPSPKIFPPALTMFDIAAEKVIFIHVQKEKEILWVIEEALKCEGLAAVIAETPEISFTATRRFQLAVEQSHVTGFIIRQNPKNLATACITRWKITPLPSAALDGLPGVGFPQWNVALLKVRNGTPGNWQLEWNGTFRHASKVAVLNKQEQRKAG